MAFSPETYALLKGIAIDAAASATTASDAADTATGAAEQAAASAAAAAANSGLAPAFDSAATYAVGDLVLYDGAVYRFTAAHTGAWDAADAEQTTLGEEVMDLDAAKANKTDVATADAAQEQMILASFPTDTIENAAVASFTDGADNIPVKALTVNITPVQSGSGDPSPTNVRHISGWTGANLGLMGKNLLGGILAANRIAEGASSSTIDESAKTIAFDTVGEDGTLLLTNDRTQGAKFFPFKPSMSYTIIGRLSRTGSGTSFGLGVIYTDGTSYRVQTSDIDSDGHLVFTTNASKTVRGIFAGYQQADGQLLYYDTFGVYEGVVAKTDSAPYTGTTYTVAFPTPPGTVYGGTLRDNGDGTWTLILTHLMVKMKDLSWTLNTTQSFQRFRADLLNRKVTSNIASTAICTIYSQHDYDAAVADQTDKTFKLGKTANTVFIRDDSYATLDAFEASLGNDDMFVYLLDQFSVPASAYKFTLTAESVKTMLGQNNIWADTGDVASLTYRADVGLYIAKKLAET